MQRVVSTLSPCQGTHLFRLAVPRHSDQSTPQALVSRDGWWEIGEGQLEKWTETRTFQACAHYDILLSLTFCFVFKLNLKWLVALKWETLPAMTLSLGENCITKKKFALMKYSCRIICQCRHQLITWKIIGRKQYYTNLFIQAFRPGNANALIKT